MSRTIGFIVTEDSEGKEIAYRNVYYGENIIEVMQEVRDRTEPGNYVFAERIIDNEQTEVIASTGEI